MDRLISCEFNMETTCTELILNGETKIYLKTMAEYKYLDS